MSECVCVCMCLCVCVPVPAYVCVYVYVCVSVSQARTVSCLLAHSPALPVLCCGPCTPDTHNYLSAMAAARLLFLRRLEIRAADDGDNTQRARPRSSKPPESPRSDSLIPALMERP